MRQCLFLACIGMSCVGSLDCQRGVQPMWSTANPSTIVEVNPVTRQVSLFNNKNVAVHMGKIDVATSQGGHYTLDGLDVSDNASDVRIANVEQIKATTELTKVVTDLIAHMTDVGGAAAGQYMTMRTTLGSLPPPTPKSVLVLDAFGRLGGAFAMPNAPSAVTIPAPAPQPATIVLPAEAPPPVIVRLPPTTQPAE